jgi:hypothetical protein
MKQRRLKKWDDDDFDVKVGSYSKPIGTETVNVTPNRRLVEDGIVWFATPLPLAEDSSIKVLGVATDASEDVRERWLAA